VIMKIKKRITNLFETANIITANK